MTDSASMSRLARMVNAKFISRKDVKARQKPDGSYYPVKSGDNYLPWTERDMLDHLEGTQTFGHYLVSTDGMAKFFAFDIDLVKPTAENQPVWRTVPFNPREVWLAPHNDEDATQQEIKIDLGCQLWAMADGLAHRTMKLMGDDVKVCIAYSGCKGLHVYALTGKLTAADQRVLAVEVLDSFDVFKTSKGNNFWQHGEGLYDCLEIEVFPKQDGVGNGGFGNLMRCPLGVNQKTGHVSYFVSGYDFERGIFMMDDPTLALTAGTFR